MLKTLSKLGLDRNFLNLIKFLIKDFYRRKKKEMKTIVNITINGEKLKTFPLRSGTKQGCPLSLLFFNLILEGLANAVRQ